MELHWGGGTHSVNFAWIFFRMPSLSEACNLIARIFTDFNTGDTLTKSLTSIEIALPFLIFKDLRDEFFPNRLLFLNTRLCRWCVYLLLFVMILTIGVLDSGQFIYVKF